MIKETRGDMYLHAVDDEGQEMRAGCWGEGVLISIKWPDHDAGFFYLERPEIVALQRVLAARIAELDGVGEITTGGPGDVPLPPLGDCRAHGSSPWAKQFPYPGDKK